jgi:hypothetical protein
MKKRERGPHSKTTSLSSANGFALSPLRAVFLDSTGLTGTKRVSQTFCNRARTMRLGETA